LNNLKKAVPLFTVEGKCSFEAVGYLGYNDIITKRRRKTMGTINILLCCAGGMSSGFLASKMRKAAKKMNLAANVEAAAESNVGQMVERYDILMVGPHYVGQLENFQKICANYQVPVVVIPKDIYGLLDGEGAMKLVIQTLEK